MYLPYYQSEIPLERRIESSKIESMTVVVGTLCDNGKAAIMASDRRVSSRDGKMSFDGPDCKIFVIGKGTLFSFAGDPPDSALLKTLRRVTENPDNGTDAESMILTLLDYLNQRRQVAAKGYPGLADQPLFRLHDCEVIDRHLPNTAYLMIAADPDAVHLSTVDPVGKNSERDIPGFAAIGNGSSLAETAFARNPHVKNYSLAQAIYVIYEAKRLAEWNDSVGETTDIAVLHHGTEPVFLDPEVMKVLEDTYQKMKPPTLSESDVNKIQDALPKSIQPSAM